MGRFSHEAVAVDPATDIVYETQDQTGFSGFYRFVPNVRQKLRLGGTLQMLAARTGAVGVPVQELGGPIDVGTTFDVAWVDIPNPSLEGITGEDAELANEVFNQGFSAGGSRFFRLEGAFYSGGKIYFDDTGGGNSGYFGQVWEYDPVNEQLRLIFSSDSRSTLDQPDNLAVCPRSGGLVLCEDGSNRVQRLRALSVDGAIAPFAENNIILPNVGNPKPHIAPGSYTDFEWAGSTFLTGGPHGQWLFVNIQTPGVTFAITGPWDRGGL
jgi:secreted PhoX family phosphatase